MEAYSSVFRREKIDDMKFQRMQKKDWQNLGIPMDDVKKIKKKVYEKVTVKYEFDDEPIDLVSD